MRERSRTSSVPRPSGRRARGFVLLVLFTGAAAGSAVAGQDPEKPRPIFSVEDRPSLRLGDAFRLDFTTKLDAELRETDHDGQAGSFEFERRRVGIQGRLFETVGFEIERELGDSTQPWRDAFVELRRWRGVRARAGRFKLPFGRERLTSIADLPFVRRSIASEALTSGRDTGVEVNGRLFGRGLAYAGGVFRHDGDVSRGGTDEPAGQTFASRVVVSPLAWTGSEALRRFEAGGAVTIGDVPEGLNGLRAQAIDGFDAVAPHYVQGRRTRVAVEAGWEYGPLALSAELLRARDQRLGQGLLGETLPDVVARGGYVSGTWTAIGALRANRPGPRRGLNDGGPGAIQLAARAEYLGFESDGTGGGEAFRNPRAAAILPNDLRVLTAGVNWLPIRFVKLQFNVVREHFSDVQRRPDPARPVRYSRVFRVQFAM